MTEFRARVALETAIVLVAVAVPAAWLGGPAAAIGVLAAGGLTVGNFWWLSRAAAAAGAAGVPQVSGWVFAAGIRLTLLFVAFAALCAGGYAHPVAVVLGLTVLPCALIFRGLRHAAADPLLPGGGDRAGGARGGHSPFRLNGPAVGPPDY
jgi:ATP synthase I subunit